MKIGFRKSQKQKFSLKAGTFAFFMFLAAIVGEGR